MKKLLFTLLIILLIFSSCADSKEFIIDGQEVIAEPYGWANLDLKIEGVKYQPCVGNIVWDVILFETIIVPIWLTGWQFYEPITYVPDAKNNK